MDRIDDIIRRAVAEKRSGKIVVDDDSLLTELCRSEDGAGLRWWQIRHAGGFGFIVVCTTVIAMTVFLLHMGMFYVNDVILFQNELKVNRYGTFVPRKSCDCEYAMFMFNTSDLWANTGIRLNRGDRVKISVSGAFHRSVVDLMRSSERNRRCTYGWIGTRERLAGEPGERDDVKYCIYSGDDAYFGSVLYQIRPESEADSPNCADAGYPVRQITPETGSKYHRVKESGIMHLSINDIYLTDTIIGSIVADNRRIGTGKNLLLDDFTVSAASAAANDIQLFRPRPGDAESVDICSEEMMDYFRNNRDVWFDDNLGQIMVVVEIQRRMSWGFFNCHKWYRVLESAIMDEFDRYDGWMTIFAVSLGILYVCLAAVLFIVMMGVHLAIAIFAIYAVFIAAQSFNDLCGRIAVMRPVSKAARRLDALLSSVFRKSAGSRREP